VRRIFSSWNLAAAHHAKNLLEVEGIRCRVRNEVLSSGMGELPPIECQIELWVLNDADAERAERILKFGTLRPEERGKVWRCGRCGEVSEAQFTQCWRCGAFRSE
jgi:Putative prokaryotic signal transducing protein